MNSLIQTQKSAELAAALLSVYLERAEDLPLRKGTKPPSPYATLAVGDTSHKTKTVPQTATPSGMRAPPFSSGNQTLRVWSCRFGGRLWHAGLIIPAPLRAPCG